MLKSVVTLKEIAAAAGCSPRAAAAVLNPSNGNVRVGQETQRRVLESAQQLGYRRNEMARAMVTGKSHVIGLLTSIGISETIMRIVEGALDEAAAQGYITKFLRLPFHATPEQVHEVVQLCTTWRLDGVVAVGLQDDVLACLNEEIKNNHRPVAYIETFADNSAAIRVGSDDAGGVRAALTHLVELGHRNIAFLGGPETSAISEARARLFRSTLKDLGVPLRKKWLLHSDWGNVRLIEAAAQHLLEANPRPTAIFCMADAIAMVTLRLARRLGLALPEQLSVIGYGNSALSTYADPPLTTIAQPFSEMGRHAVQRLLIHIKAGDGEVTAPSCDSLAQKLIVRGSTAPLEKV